MGPMRCCRVHEVIGGSPEFTVRPGDHSSDWSYSNVPSCLSPYCISVTSTGDGDPQPDLDDQMDQRELTLYIRVNQQ